MANAVLTEFNCNGTFAKADPLKVIRARSSLIALPSRVKKQCIQDIECWYKSNGPEWTVDRLKYIKQCAINYLTMGKLPPSNDAEHWFKKNSSGLFYGHWGSILKLMVQRPKVVSMFLMCYTAFARTGQPTTKMIDKYKETLESTFSGDAAALEIVNSNIEKDSRKIFRRYVPHLLQDTKYPEHYIINARANNPLQTEDLMWVVQDFLTSQFGRDVTQSYDWVLPSLGLEGYTIPNYPDGEEILKLILGDKYKVKPFVMAKVNWINEPGMKERVVADYVKVLEFLTKPFGEKLYDIVRDVPWDATYHEERGYNQIKRYLKQNKPNTKCWCFDLSKATDRFPLSTQVAVLKGLSRELGPRFTDMMNIFVESCSLPAELPDGRLTHWEVGQPMGAYPSFALFSLSHGMVLMQYLHSKGHNYNDQFVVHGDDLVIMDKELADYYSSFIEDVAGARINRFKTIESAEYAELNSRLVSAKGIIRFPKWKPVTPSSLLDQIETWGPKCIKWCYRSKTKIEAIQNLLSIPYILPSGNSINPRGISEYDRFMSAPDRVLEEILYPKPVLKDFTSIRQHILRRFRADTFIALSNDVNFKHRIDIGSDLAELYCRMKLSALDVADTLDREIQQDLMKFLEFGTSEGFMKHITNCDMPYSDTTLDTILIAASEQLRQFHELFGYSELVGLNFIRQDTSGKPKFNKTFGASRLNKLVKLYRREQQKLDFHSQPTIN